MYKYFPHTEDDLQAMLAAAGVKSLDELYAQLFRDALADGVPAGAVFPADGNNHG